MHTPIINLISQRLHEYADDAVGLIPGLLFGDVSWRVGDLVFRLAMVEVERPLSGLGVALPCLAHALFLGEE